MLARPEQLAAAAQVEVDLGELEAVGRRDERLEPLLRRLGQLLLRPRDEEAVRLLGSAPDAAAELVQLSETEAVGLLDDHHGRVRDVDADLDHGRRDEHVELARVEVGHDGAPRVRLQPAVHAADAELAELGASEPLGLVLGRARERRLRCLDERADDVGLPALAEQPREPGVRLGGLLLLDPARDDRLARRRRLRDLGDGEIAVHRERERARDRRRGHVQHVRRATLRQRLALLDAEAVLLVDDRDREIAQLDALLDQRVRADDDVRAERRRAHLLRRRAREQCARDAELGADAFDREEVLFGERLCRRHQRALASVLDRAQQCVERDDRLAGADVALQQPLHRNRALEIGVDLAHRLLLVRRERERKRRAVALDQLAGRAERRRERALAFRRAPRDAELEQQQLLEREPLPPGLRLVLGLGMVDDEERVALQRHRLAVAQLGRQRVGVVDDVPERVRDERPQPLRRDLLARGIDRREVFRRLALADVVRLDVEAVAARLAAQTDVCARLSADPRPTAG